MLFRLISLLQFQYLQMIERALCVRLKQPQLYTIQNEEPGPLTGLRSGVPMELECIVHKALCKNPNERYQHISEMLVDLKNLKKKQLIGNKKTITKYIT